MHLLSKQPSVYINLVVFFICFNFYRIDSTPYDRLKKGDILNCAFYNAESNSILKFKDGYLNYTRWSGASGDPKRYLIEKGDFPYTFNQHGLSGYINGVSFIVLNRNMYNSPTFYFKYNGLIYILSEVYSN